MMRQDDVPCNRDKRAARLRSVTLSPESPETPTVREVVWPTGSHPSWWSDAPGTPLPSNSATRETRSCCRLDNRNWQEIERTWEIDIASDRSTDRDRLSRDICLRKSDDRFSISSVSFESRASEDTLKYRRHVGRIKRFPLILNAEKSLYKRTIGGRIFYWNSCLRCMRIRHLSPKPLSLLTVFSINFNSVGS